MTGRDDRGRFAPGNPYAAQGGQVRATKLSPDRRRAIARLGFLAFVDRYFAGDRTAAVAWLGRLGAWAADQTFVGSPIYKPDVYRHPGPLRRPEGRRP